MKANGIRNLGEEIVEVLHPNFLHHRLQVILSVREEFIIH